MKVYEKPKMVIEEYEASGHISTCEPNKFVPPFNVVCAIKSGEQHGVYDMQYSGEVPDGYSKCETDDGAVSLVVLGKSGDSDTTYTTYAVWYGSAGGSPGSGEYDADTGVGDGNALKNALISAGCSGSSGSGVLHAGVASSELISWINHS